MKAKVKKRKSKFTIMFVPHDNTEIKSLKIPGWIINSLAVFGLFSMLICSVLLIRSMSLETTMVENDKLKVINSVQSSQIKVLKEDTEDAINRLKDIEETKTQVREMVGLTEEAEEKDVSRGEGGAAFPSRSVVLGAVDYSSDVRTDEEKYGLEDIESIKKNLEYINSEIDEQGNSLKKLQKETGDRLEYLAALPTGWPAKGRITSKFGWRKNPFTHRGSEFHPGLDIANSYGTRLLASGAGRVIFAGYKSGYGYTVIIKHGYGYTSQYSHCSYLKVKVGQKVKRGDYIARMGSTGRATGTHIHFGIAYNGKFINPLDMLK